MGEEMKHGLTKAVLGMYLVSTFVFCVTLAKDDPSGRSIWARMRPDAGSLGMYCISSAYPNFTLPDAVQAAADDGQRAQQTAPDTLTLTGTDGSEAQVSEIITTEETAPEPVVFGEAQRYYQRPGITYLPIRDAPLGEWALIWRSRDENPFVHAFVRAARDTAARQ